MADQPTTHSQSAPNTWTWSSLFRLLIGGFGVVAVLMIPVARWLSYEQDHALSNVLTMILLSVFLTCLIAWLLLAPKIGLARRVIILAVPVVSVAIFMSLFEFRGFTGEMLPIFKQRRESSSGSRSDASVAGRQSDVGKPSDVDGTD